jgi:hypothetical protein
MKRFDDYVRTNTTNFDMSKFFEMNAWGGLKQTQLYNEKAKNQDWVEELDRYLKAAKSFDTHDCE